MVGGLAQGFSLDRAHPRGGYTDTDLNNGFTKGISAKIFGEDFGGGSGGTATPFLGEYGKYRQRQVER